MAGTSVVSGYRGDDGDNAAQNASGISLNQGLGKRPRRRVDNDRIVEVSNDIE